jgi:hypothetical protein
MLPKATIRHPTGRRMPLHRCLTGSKGTDLSASAQVKDITIATTTPENAIVVSTYLPGEFRCYRKTISVVGGETTKSAFERASEVPFEIPGSLLSNPEHTITTTDADFMDRLWLLGITLVLIMASGERLLEPGVRLKTVKPKRQADRPTEYWSPNYLGRVFRAETENGDPENHQRPHWRKGHLKSEAHGPRSSLRKIIWIQPYGTGTRDEEQGPSSARIGVSDLTRALSGASGRPIHG